MLNHDEQDKILFLAKQIAETYNPRSIRNDAWIVTRDFQNRILIIFSTLHGAHKWCLENGWKHTNKEMSNDPGKNVTITRWKIHGS